MTPLKSKKIAWIIYGCGPCEIEKGVLCVRNLD